MPLQDFVTISRCYLTANAFNDRVLRLQNEFLCLSCLSENCQTIERDAFLCVLGVVHIVSNSAKLRHFQFSVCTSKFLLSTVHVLCYVNQSYWSYNLAS